MPIHNRVARGLEEVDVIIAGGGAAGCVVAGRLAATDPSLKVLLIEGGEDNYAKDNVVNPALFREHLAPNSRTAVFYQSTKQSQLADREVVVPTGGILGGGSSINIALYSRPCADDLDSWNTEGWSSKELLPLLKRFETYHGPGRKELHGFDGPVQVSDGGGVKAKNVQSDIIRAAEACGYPEVPDLQDLRSANNVEKAMSWVALDGKRQDAAHTFIHPLIRDGGHPNLHVLCQAKVIRVLFDENKKATGIEYTPNPEYQVELNLAIRPKTIIKAQKMVVLCCGAFGTPLLLERSGVGNSAVLQKAGVDLVADVPGVGNEYQDHHLIFYPYRTKLKAEETIDALFDGRITRTDALANQLPVLGWNACDVAFKIRPADEEIARMSDDFQKMWQQEFAGRAHRPMMMMAVASSYLGDHATIEPGQYLSMAAYTAYPKSRGSLHITGPDWEDPISFDVGFFNDPQDLDIQMQIWAYKKQRQIMRRTNLYAGELESGHPQFREISHAACADFSKNAEHAEVGAGDPIQDFEYSAEDDKAIECWLRANIQTTWHSLGTCKMAPLDQKGVIDKNLNVYGVSGLKCCDLSIVPENVAANTMGTALLIGEKGADIVLSELGLSQPDNRAFKRPG